MIPWLKKKKYMYIQTDVCFMLYAKVMHKGHIFNIWPGNMQPVSAS